MISAAELAALQATSQSAGDLSIGVYRLTVGQDGEGNVTRSYALAATVNGNLAQPTAGQLQNYGYAIADVAAWMVRVPVGTDIRIGDRLLVGAQYLEVQVELQPQSYQTAMRVLCAEVMRT
jgi:head-tail adaptor